MPLGLTPALIPVRRVLSCGGMRFQAPKVPANTMEFCPANAEHFVPAEAQANVEEIVIASMKHGITHFETAKYGCSELMLGIALRKLFPKRSDYILQTKVSPMTSKNGKDPEGFRKNLHASLDLLAPDDPDAEEGSGYIDLFSMHGINRTKELEWILQPGGCMDIAKEFQRQGKIKHIGFSTHGMSTGIVDVINSGEFDYVNLHYHYIGSYTASGSGSAANANSRAIEAAKKQDMGMFIISPYDKGGYLYKPSKKLEDTCQSNGLLHPVAFNSLWSLDQPDIHTLVIGAARTSDFDIAAEACQMLADPSSYQGKVAAIDTALQAMAVEVHGQEWMDNWWKGVPDAFGNIDAEGQDEGTSNITNFENNPFGINFTMAAWLYTITKAWDIMPYARDRYAEYVGNEKAWAKDVEENGKTPAEIIEAWGWTPGRTMTVAPSDEDVLKCLAKAAVGPEKMLAALKEGHEMLKPDSEVEVPPLGKDLTEGWTDWPGRTPDPALTKALMPGSTSTTTTTVAGDTTVVTTVLTEKGADSSTTTTTVTTTTTK